MNKPNFTPAKDRILVKQFSSEEKIGSIIIPDNAKQKPFMGTVISLSKEEYSEPLVFGEGDTVLFGKVQGRELYLEGEEYLLLQPFFIFGKIC